MITKNESYLKSIEKITTELESIRVSIDREEIHPVIISLIVLIIDKILAFFELLQTIFYSLKNDIPLSEYYSIIDSLNLLIKRLSDDK